ncbi:efflux RND transporter periplasmic adaptor subunit [Ferrovum myxofaciens]|uniref:efflux RND transporter periplasmic adaptor subunit n=1 Tax=Ferrovum myxofaciens TaxID=416213 RepID=UPI0005582FA7|nr:efflux RND transporter periplasmic adaptor subunit [Ferrovum myxofaciens]
MISSRFFGGLIFLVAVGVAAWGIMSRLHAQTALAQYSMADAQWQVEVTHALPESHVPDLILPGQLQAWTETPIYAHTSGYLKHWAVDIGQKVKAGQEIAEISTPDIDAQEAQAEAEMRTAEANDELARVTAQRYAALLPTKTVSPQDADNKRLDAEAKKTALDAARANLERLHALDRFRKIVAPVDGIITARNVDVGTMIDSGSANGKATELFHLADARRLRAYIPVPEDEVSSLPAGGAVNIEARTFPGRIWNTQLVRHAQAIDPINHTELVELNLEGGILLPGSYIEVHFPRHAAKQSVTLPANTLVFRANGTSVAVVNEHQVVSLKPVIVGRDLGERIEILAGISSSDRVVVSPPDSLADGVTVVAREAGALRKIP